MFDKKCFEVTENHIKLIRKMYVSWQDCETGAPEINPKRPYGNSGVIWDIKEILDILPQLDMDDDWAVENFYEEFGETLMEIHQETETALQIVLSTGSFEPGVYEADEFHINWRRVDGPS